VPNTRTRSLFGRRFLRHLWHLTRAYWSSPDGRSGGLLYATAIAFELGTVRLNVFLAGTQRRIFDEIQTKAMVPFLQAVAIFLAFALLFVVVSTYRIYVRQILEIRWRRWLTDHFLDEWMGSQAYYRMELHREHTDNPDQRIAEDVRDYVASALGLSLSLISSVATLASFAGILWTLSGDWMIKLGSREFQIPGFMMWVAILYAGLATWITHRVGRPLVPINFDQQRFEADFRYTLVRFRENTEAVAFYRGEDGERIGAKSRFHRVVDNWLRLIRAQRNLALCTIGLGQTNSIVPLLVAAPGYFLGRLTLGDVIQTNIAYSQVSGALVWFVNAYQEIAHWRASVERLFSFNETIDESHAELAHNVGIDFEANPDPAIRLDDLRVELPNGRALLDGVNQSIAAGDKLLLTGPSGSGKSTLFRTLAGLWPFGHGRVEIPEKGKKLFLPQHPYLPMGTLRAAASYPSCEGTFSDERIEEVLRQVGLERFQGRLSEDAHWEQQMSGGEQQQLAFARVLLQRPDWVFLDESTSALDEATEERVYELLEDQLPDATVVSIAHRPGVAQYHRRRWTLVPHDGHMSIEAA